MVGKNNTIFCHCYGDYLRKIEEVYKVIVKGFVGNTIVKGFVGNTGLYCPFLIWYNDCITCNPRLEK